MRGILGGSKIAVVKFGTAIVTAPNGAFNRALMSEMAKVMSRAIEDGWRVAVVSSGAVGLGRGIIDQSKRPLIGEETVADKQLLAAFGQGELIKSWADIFLPTPVAQFLVTNRQFRDQERVQLKRNCLAALELGVPVWNENDPLTGRELEVDGSSIGFSDNSELAWLVAYLLGAVKLIYLSNVQGLLDEQGELTKKLSIGHQVTEVDAGNPVGRGGMLMTVKYACQAMKAGTCVHIADGRTADPLRRIFAGEYPGTYGAPCT